MPDEMPTKSIEAEIEQTRAQLASTIDQLVYRAHPKTIANRQANAVKAHFVDASGQPRTDNIIKVASGVLGAVVAIVILRKIVN